MCFAMELAHDAVASPAALPPETVRFKNLVRPEQMPFDNITRKHFDSGDYPQALTRALEAIGADAVRARQGRGESDGRRFWLGLAVYCEHAADGKSVYAGWGIPMVPGREQASARVTPDGGLEGCASAPTRTDRDSRRRWLRSRMKSSAFPWRASG